MLTYEARSRAAPVDVWQLLAQPARWHEWAPHVRGGCGLGAPEVRAGALGVARVLWLAPLPVRILDVEPGRSWAWQVGPVVSDHRVEPDGDGSRVIIELTLRGLPEAPLALTYGPIVARLVRNLARVAEKGAGR